MSTDDPHADAVQHAVGDLAGRLDVPADRIAVVRVDEVTWRDGSLGCPRPGMFYNQSLVEGLRILLRCEGGSYSYHAGGCHEPFLCEDAAGDSAL